MYEVIHYLSLQVKRAHKVMSDLLMATTYMKGGWNFAITINGVLSVMMLLVGQIVLWCAGSLDLVMLVCTFYDVMKLYH